MNNNVFLSNVASVVSGYTSDEDDRQSFWCLRLLAERSGVTVEGSASFPEEADTAPVADTKTEEEKKAAEGHAVAVKASGKKKEFLN
ncbi:hypothetical protein Hanom_Chr16g01498711 [Helianthus anomalus]